ncbi:MAG: hypothetical protein CV087_16120, partial [Candidatus Brocadia sp. WS118]
MPQFYQVYYTSCVTGLSGSSGFQFNAASPELEPHLLRLIERFCVYVPPASAPPQPSPAEIENLPVSLFYSPLQEGGGVIAQAKYLGKDYSNRYGNYFVHALVAKESDLLIENFPPISFWRFSHWKTQEQSSTELPAIEVGELKGGIQILEVAQFLKDGDRLKHLPALLTAVEDSFRTKRPLIIVDDNKSIALWIAAIFYAFPLHIALRLSFNTYVKNPYQADFKIIGTTPDSDFRFSQNEMEYQFYVFDFKGNRFSSIQNVSGFAEKITYLYKQKNLEEIIEFNSPGKYIDPALPIEDLDSALSYYALNRNLDVPGIHDRGALALYTKRLSTTDPGSIDPIFLNELFNLVIQKHAPDLTLLEVCTEFFRTAMQVETIRNRPGIWSAIERSYLTWLLDKAFRVISLEQLSKTLANLEFSDSAIRSTSQLKGIWIERFEHIQSKDPTNLLDLIHFGEKFGFLSEKEKGLEKIGKDIIAPNLNNLRIQKMLFQLASEPVGKNIIAGICESLTENLELPETQDRLELLVSNQDIFPELRRIALEKNYLKLYYQIIQIDLVESREQPFDAFKKYMEDMYNLKQSGHSLSLELVDSI